MDLTVCTHCGTMLQLPENSLGKRVQCTQCHKTFVAQSVKKKLSSALPPPPASAARTVTCTHCRTDMRLPDNWTGKQVQCVKCNTILDVPSTAKNSSISRPPSPPRNTIPTVVAQGSGPADKVSRRLHLGWVIAACAALLVPIVTASTFTGWRLARARKSAEHGSSSKAVYAGIEIGSNGPRYCVVEFSPETNGGDNFHVVAHEATTARLTSKMGTTGSFNEDDLRKTISAVQTFHERMMKEHNIPAEQIVIVSSDTLFGPIVKRLDIGDDEKERQISRCRDTLSEAVKKATGQTMEFVSLTKFAEHELRAVVRKNELKDAVFLDIGGGSTRGAYCDAANLIQAAEGSGITSFIARVKDGLLDEGDFAERAQKMSEQHLCEPFRASLGKDPEFTARNKIYLAGGIAWVMANCQHPGDTEEYVHLSAGDIEQFTAKVRKQPELLTTIRPDDALPAERQEWLKGEYARMRNAFKTPERLVAGAEILQALCSELKFAGRDIWFYRHSDFAWVASYIDETRGPRK